MRFTNVLIALSLVLGVSACKKKEGAATQSGSDTPAKTTEAKADKPAGGARAIPNGAGLVVDAPAKWLDNGIGGAAGLHLDNNAGGFQIMDTSPEEAAKKLADFKKDTEEMLFEKWISADETPDGFKTLYVIDNMVTKGDQLVKDGTKFAFHVRRKIGDKTRDCSGTGDTQEIATEAIDLCMKVAAK
jgi:hypothetical protein